MIKLFKKFGFSIWFAILFVPLWFVWLEPMISHGHNNIVNFIIALAWVGILLMNFNIAHDKGWCEGWDERDEVARTIT